MGSPRPETFSRTYPAVANSVPEARHDVLAWLRERADGDSPPLDAIALAVSEAVGNAVNHAYRDGEPGEIRVQACPSDDGVQILIEDDGRGMLPRADSPGVGLGLPLIATIASRFDTKTKPGAGTRLCIWFRAGARRSLTA